MAPNMGDQLRTVKCICMFSQMNWLEDGCSAKQEIVRDKLAGLSNLYPQIIFGKISSYIAFAVYMCRCHWLCSQSLCMCGCEWACVCVGMSGCVCMCGCEWV